MYFVYALVSQRDKKRENRLKNDMGFRYFTGRRSTFENANVILVLESRRLAGEEEVTEVLDRLDHLCRKITNFQKNLRT